jgi:hypothetical protein
MYIPTRHAARTPPPPDLIVSGLLRLTSFRKLQNATQSFEVSVQYYKLFASSLLVLWGAGRAGEWSRCAWRGRVWGVSRYGWIGVQIGLGGVQVGLWGSIQSKPVRSGKLVAIIFI